MEDLRQQFEAVLARVAGLEAELARTQAALAGNCLAAGGRILSDPGVLAGLGCA